MAGADLRVVLDGWAAAPCDSVIIQAFPGEPVIRVRAGAGMAEVRKRIEELTAKIRTAADAQLALSLICQGVLMPAEPAA